MQNKAVINLCKSRGRLETICTQDCMWVGMGGAYYALRGVPMMSIENICSVFDIPDKKAADMMFSSYNEDDLPFLFEDATEDEIQLETSLITIQIAGDTLRGYDTGSGIEFLNTDYFSPLTGKEMEDIRIFWRHSGKLRYFAIKVGLELVAIFFPHSLPLDLEERLKRASELLRLKRMNDTE